LPGTGLSTAQHASPTAERRDGSRTPGYPEGNSLCSKYGVYVEYSV